MAGSAAPQEHRYELVERLAVGGMAEVFLAKTYGSHGFEKVLAIKRILPGLASSQEFERRFIAEAKIAVTLNHANIVQVLDFSRFGESLYIAMEYVDGMDLAALLKSLRARGNMPVGAALHVAMEILKGLDFAHRRGVVHRDVSPSNVLVSRAGEVKIADFGIAQAADAGASITRTRRIMGKWRYMSPEQTRGDRMDSHSDVFSAGSVLFELFTGDRLFPGDDVEQIVNNIASMPIPSVVSRRPQLPAQIDEVLGPMLARNPADRPDVSTMLRALVDISYERSLHATAMSVADVLGEVAPPPRDLAVEDTTSKSRVLMDDILSSEGTAGTRVTAEATGLPQFHPDDVPSEVTMTFVGVPAPPGELRHWTLGETRVTALPAPPRPPKRTPWALVAVAVATVAALAVALIVMQRDREPEETAVPVEAPAPFDAAVKVVVTQPPPDAAVDNDADAAPLRASVAITSSPPGATVTIGGEKAGITPFERADLDPGELTFELSLDGYQSVTQAVTVTPGERTEAHIDLDAARPKFGTIDIYAEPWANVYFHGRKVGVAPQRGLRLPVGKHRLRLANPVQNKSTTITVVVPSSKPYRVTLP